MRHFIFALLALVFTLSSDPAFAALTQTQVSQLYVSIFGRASEGEGNSYWQTDPQSTSMTATANVMLNTDSAKEYFGATLNNNQDFIEHIYLNALGKTYAEDAAGVDYWVSELNAGKSMGEIIAALIVAAQYSENAGAAQDRFNNKIAVSNYCADKISQFTDLAIFVEFIASVTNDASSVISAKLLIDSEAPVPSCDSNNLEFCTATPPSGIGTPPPGNGQYAIIAWNDLGMHCMDPSYEDFSILPPYNTLWAQVIRRGNAPAITTSGVTVEYRILGNTRSDNKTNFWQYAQTLFGLAQPLTLNVGLKGNGLSGLMKSAGDHFVAEAIPLTEYLDNNLTAPYPYQVAEFVARDSNGTIVASTQAVAPVSTELHCEYCHNDNGSANYDIATGVVKQNILILHDQKHSTTLMAQRPVLCASCHSSNALGTAGQQSIPNLSSAIHGRHANAGIDDGTMTGTCYACHPGAQTKCLRGAMFLAGTTCYDCHGGLANVANPNRKPWIEEPRCDQCHDASHGENSGTLYRFSKGHQGIYCQACHGSQHAISPSRENNDNVQAILLQNHTGTIDTCTVCHLVTPSFGGPHNDTMHPIGQIWVSEHQHVNKSTCAQCHGTTSAGTPYSTVKTAETIDAGEYGVKNWAAGYQVSCYSCHNGPNPD